MFVQFAVFNFARSMYASEYMADCLPGGGVEQAMLAQPPLAGNPLAGKGGAGKGGLGKQASASR